MEVDGGDGRDGCECHSGGEALVLQKFRFLLGVVRDFAKISLSRILSRFRGFYLSFEDFIARQKKI